ncbi:MAG: PD40 domain-containing protein, partial [Planctomycetaceae bacterium]|nr:PD40 domain-containing protein [Planctomycetaceae bacterium]
LSDSLIAVARGDDPVLELHLVETAEDATKLQGVIPFDAKLHGNENLNLLQRITNRVSLSADGKWLAAISLEGDRTRVSVYDAAKLAPSGDSPAGLDSDEATPPTLPATNKVQIETPYVQGLAFNSNNSALAVLGEEDLLFLNARTGKAIGKAESPSNGPRRFVCPHPDPSLFFVCDGPHFFKLIDARTGKVVREHNASHHFSSTARWSPDGKWLAYTHDQAGSLFSSDLKHNDGLNDVSFELTETERIATGAAFSPRGEWVAMIRVDGRIVLFKSSGERKWEQHPGFQSHPDRGTDVAFMGNEFASIGAEGTIKFWQMGREEPSRTISLGGKLADAKFLNNSTVALVREDATQLELHAFDSSGDASRVAAVVPFDSSYHASGGERYFERIINRVALSHNGSVLVASAPREGSTELSFYDLRRLKNLLDSTEPNRAHYRTWSTADGKFQVEAQLIALSNGVAKLKRKSDGIVVDVPLRILTEADQSHAKATTPD